MEGKQIVGFPLCGIHCKRRSGGLSDSWVYNEEAYVYEEGSLSMSDEWRVA
jgi:hypothetical protein